MLDKLLSYLLKSDNKHKILWLPLLASIMTWGGQVLVALGDDGIISDDEFHRLTQGASSVETVALVLIMAILKAKR